METFSKRKRGISITACGILEIIQKKKKEVEGNVCLVLRTILLIVAQCMQCDHSTDMCLKIFSYQLNHAIICGCSTDQDN